MCFVWISIVFKSFIFVIFLFFLNYLQLVLNDSFSKYLMTWIICFCWKYVCLMSSSSIFSDSSFLNDHLYFKFHQIYSNYALILPQTRHTNHPHFITVKHNHNPNYSSQNLNISFSNNSFSTSHLSFRQFVSLTL